MSDYRDTIRLPKTGFSMKGNLIRKEPAILDEWNATDMYGRIREARRGAPLYILHDGPPYANGHVHLGTALNKILKDFIVRSRTMMGYDSPYVPGWDCHGMPIEHRVVGERKAAGEKLPREEVRRLCREYAARYVEVQKGEFRRLGVFGTWDRPYLTMDPSYEAGIVRAFGELVERGYVYLGLRPIHWCMSCRTALAEAEVEYAPKASPSIYVAFEQAEPKSWKAKGVPPGTKVVIWTTTPWTLPANLAVALNPAERYVIVSDGTDSYLVAERRREAFGSATGFDGRALPEPVFTGSELEGLRLVHPLDPDRTSLVIAAEHVTMEDGTGCVHTAPGHGAEDFVVGRRHGLEILSPVSETGHFTDRVERYSGMHVMDANPAIVQDLRESGALLQNSTVEHSYPHCWRCKQPLIFRATRQFFLDLAHRDLRERVLERVEEVDWHPAWGHERMRNMMKVRPDWCLSRQRAWGVALPVFTCLDCSSAVMDREVIAAVADLVEEEGSDVWFERTPGELFALAGREAVCPECGGELERVDDILDVWFDSSLSHYNVLDERYGLERPCSVYLEATDQHRGWFGVSLITSEALEMGRPADNVITHGLIQDRDGRKMSKSLGNVISPLEIIDTQGADILRLWFASVDYTADFRADLTQLDDARQAYKKLRNTLRFMLGNLSGFRGDGLDPDSLSGLDRYAYLRLRSLQRACAGYYADFEFHRAYRDLRNFAVIDLSNLLLDARKDRLYCDDPDSPPAVATRSLLAHTLRELVKLLAPLVPFTAEEAWKALPEHLREGRDSVHLALFPEVCADRAEEEEMEAWQPYLEARSLVKKRLEEARESGLIRDGLQASVRLGLPGRMTGSARGEDWADFLIVSRVEVHESEEMTAEVRLAPGEKCQRCWKVLPDVGSHEPADVCGRCASVIASLRGEEPAGG